MRTKQRGQTPIERRGQALMELAVGMFALALVVSALCGFALYIVKSLKVQNALRSSSPQMNENVEIGTFAELNFAGRSELKMNERVVMPSTEVVK